MDARCTLRLRPLSSHFIAPRLWRQASSASRGKRGGGRGCTWPARTACASGDDGPSSSHPREGAIAHIVCPALGVGGAGRGRRAKACSQVRVHGRAQNIEMHARVPAHLLHIAWGGGKCRQGSMAAGRSSRAQAVAAAASSSGSTERRQKNQRQARCRKLAVTLAGWEAWPLAHLQRSPTSQTHPRLNTAPLPFHSPLHTRARVPAHTDTPMHACARAPAPCDAGEPTPPDGAAGAAPLPKRSRQQKTPLQKEVLEASYLSECVPCTGWGAAPGQLQGARRARSVACADHQWAPGTGLPGCHQGARAAPTHARTRSLCLCPNPHAPTHRPPSHHSRTQ